MKSEYPIYDAFIGSDDEGIFQISLVDCPAVETLWTTFAKEDGKKVQMYSVEDEEQHLITGCFLRADYPILRKDDQGKYFYIRFSKDVIKTMVMKWMSEGRANLINQQHTEDTQVDNIFLQEVFIKDSTKGISPKGYEDIEEGSAFATYKVLDEDIWNKIKDGTFNGFSIECVTEIVPEGYAEEEKTLDEIIDLLNKIKDKRQ